MNHQSDPITEMDLHAYIDGQLESERKTLVEKYLIDNPEAKHRIEQYQTYNLGFHELYDDTLEEQIPARLINRQTKTITIPWRNAAALVMALGLGSVLGWIVHDNVQTSTRNSFALVNDAFTSHAVYTPEVRHPVEVGNDQIQHLFGWLSKRLKTKVNAPPLNSLGYELLGGRLLGSEGEPAAQFMYENPQGQRLTLFLRHKKQSEVETAFRFANRNNTRGFYWVDGNLGYALIGDVEKPVLFDAAHLVYTSLN